MSTGDDHFLPPTSAPQPAPPRTRPQRSWSVVSGGFLLLTAAVLEVVALVPTEAPHFDALGHLAGTAAPAGVLAAGLALAAVLVAVPGRRAAPAGTAIAAGLVLADLGLLIAELGGVLAVSRLGAGDALLIAAWAVAAVGTLAAVAGQRGGALGRVARPQRRDNALLTILVVVTAVVVGVALLPAWDRYDLTFTASSSTLLEGSAFATSTPTTALVGDIVAAVLFVVVALFAVLWRPGRIGILAVIGVVTVVLGQTLSAVLGAGETSIGEFGAYAQLRQQDLVTVRTSLTGWFDAEVIAMVALLVLIVARWWTPAGGSLLDSYPVEGGRGQTAPSYHPAGPPGVATPSWGSVPAGSTSRSRPPSAPGSDGGPHGTTAGQRRRPGSAAPPYTRHHGG